MLSFHKFWSEKRLQRWLCPSGGSCLSTVVSLEVFSRNVYGHCTDIPLIMCLSTAGVAGALSHTKPVSVGNLEFVSSPEIQLSYKNIEVPTSHSKHASHVLKILLYMRRNSCLETQIISLRTLPFSSWMYVDFSHKPCLSESPQIITARIQIWRSETSQSAVHLLLLRKTRSHFFLFNIVFTVHLVYIKHQDQLDAQSLLKTLIVV
jgi:hypothetical protein